MPKAKRSHQFKHILVRHHCVECNARVFPFDKYEDRTEAPTEGKPVLLQSWNARHKDERRAWCWVCEQFRPCKRLIEREIREMYLRRRGVITRAPARR